MSAQSTISLILKQEFVRRVSEEGIPRLKKCINLLTEDQIWHRPNKHSNSIGNLVVHLNGNVQQWIFTTFGNKKDTRDRHGEFDKNLRLSKNNLLVLLDKLDQEIIILLNKIEVKQIDQMYPVQCYVEHGVSILIHVIEHFSYHVGQVTFYTKLLLDVDTKYYDGQDLSKTV